jgi:hypothetical protein
MKTNQGDAVDSHVAGVVEGGRQLNIATYESGLPGGAAKGAISAGARTAAARKTTITTPMIWPMFILPLSKPGTGDNLPKGQNLPISGRRISL